VDTHQEPVKVETLLLKICHKKRKDVSSPIMQVSILIFCNNREEVFFEYSDESSAVGTSFRSSPVHDYTHTHTHTHKHTFFI